MSAFIVSNSTIRAIVEYAFLHRVSVKRMPGDNRPSQWAGVLEYKENAIGQALLEANYVSVNYRYSQKDRTPEYVHSGLPAMHNLQPIVIIKLCHCLEYQACEVPDWRESWAKHFLTRVVESATRRLPGYDAAPWGLDEDA